MRLTNIPKKIKEMRDLPKSAAIPLIIALIVIGSVLVQKLLIQDKNHQNQLRITASSEQNTPRMYVGAVSGTSYYLPWCDGAKRIHEANQVWFRDRGEAEAKSYQPAKNCKGI
jgi:vancomycin permeability regulator SanA